MTPTDVVVDELNRRDAAELRVLLRGKLSNFVRLFLQVLEFEVWLLWHHVIHQA
jgi:hypothetical protein